MSLKSELYNKKFKKFQKFMDKRIKEAYPRVLRKVKNSPYYHKQCPKCHSSNKNWLEQGGDLWEIPIKSAEDEIGKDYFYSKKTDYGIKIFYRYHCRQCGHYFE